MIKKKKKDYTPDDLPFGWEEKMLDMAKEGCGDCEIFKELGITYYIHKNLLKNFDEYSAVYENVKLYAESWWFKKGRENIENNRFNNGLWIFIGKNRFGYRDQPLMEKPGSAASLDDEREKDILLSKYQSKVEKETLMQTDKIQ